ncbi:glycosyltransferase family 2 protein [bacterium]|nr:glycosyltransferase family 2 protein [bacterium]
MSKQSINNVAIITPSYNNLDGLIGLVSSLERQTWPLKKIKLYICNDGSTDKTVEHFERLSFKIDIEMLTHAKKAGPASARNMGLEKAKADLILFLDSDLEAAPDLIERHIESYSTPDVLAVRGENQAPESTKRNKWIRYLDSELRGPRHEYSKSGKTEISYKDVNTNNFSVRSSVLASGLRFDEQIIYYGGEDMVFAYEITRQNVGRIIYQPKAMIFHHHRSFNATLIKLEEYGEETMPYLLKTYPEIGSNLVISRFYNEDWKTEKVFWPKIVFNRLGYLFSTVLKVLLPDVLAFRAIQYIMAWHVLKGYRKNLKQEH